MRFKGLKKSSLYRCLVICLIGLFAGILIGRFTGSYIGKSGVNAKSNTVTFESEAPESEAPESESLESEASGSESLESETPESESLESLDIDEFNNKDIKIGVVKGYVFDHMIKEHLPEADIKYYDSREDTFKALTHGKVDAVVDDDAIIRSMMRSTDLFIMVDEYLEASDYSFIFPKNEEGDKLRKEFDEYVDKLKSDGSLEALDEKWFGNRTDNKKSQDLPLISEDSQEEDSQEKDNSKDKDSSKVIKLAIHDGESIPFAYLSAGKPVGYEIDIINGFCQEYDYKVSYEMKEFSKMLKGVSKEKYDMACGGITITEERAESLYFGKSIYSGGAAICILNPDSLDAVKLGLNASDEVDKSAKGITRFIRHFTKSFVEERRYVQLLKGLLMTLAISFCSVLLGAPLGFLLYKGSKRGYLVNQIISKVIVWLLHGIPAVMLIIIVYYAFYKRFAVGGIIASVTGFTLDFAIMCYKNIDKNSRRVEEGKIAEDYRLEYYDDIGFVKRLFKACGNDILEDFRDDLVTLIKTSAVVGYVAVQDMVKTFDKIRLESLETVMPLIATTLLYIIIIKLITHIFRPDR